MTWVVTLWESELEEIRFSTSRLHTNDLGRLVFAHESIKQVKRQQLGEVHARLRRPTPKSCHFCSSFATLLQHLKRTRLSSALPYLPLRSERASSKIAPNQTLPESTIVFRHRRVREGIKTALRSYTIPPTPPSCSSERHPRHSITLLKFTLPIQRHQTSADNVFVLFQYIFISADRPRRPHRSYTAQASFAPAHVPQDVRLDKRRDVPS